MADPVDIYFELHIQPLFRSSDRLQMLFRFDLWNYDDVADAVNRDAILARVELPADDISVMPKLNFGGPWPQEWIDLLRRWYDTGAKRLEKGVATYAARRNAGANAIELSARGQVPAPNYAVWLDQRPERVSPAEFVLYQKPGGKFQSNFATKISFADPGPALTSVEVYDRNNSPIVVPIA